MSLDTLNGIEYLGAHLKFKVSGYRERGDGNVYYRITIQYTLEEPFRREDFEYTYDNCLYLQTSLNLQCPDLPQLPGTGLFGFKPSGPEMERRRLDIEKWLSAIVWRCDVLGSRDFQNFCNTKLRKLFEHKWLIPPRPSIKLHSGQHYPVVDFHYEPDTQACFVLTSDDSISSKMQGFMGIFGKTRSIAHSQLICYRLDVDDQGEPLVRLLWEAQYQHRASMLRWDEKLTILGVGFDTGLIICLRVSTHKGYSEYQEFCEIRKHTQCINGIAFNCLTGHVYSISKDKCLITTDLANPNSVLKEKEFLNELTCLITNEYRLFVGDAVGNVYIFNFREGPLQAAHQIKQDVKMFVTSLSFCPNKNLLLVGSKEGFLGVYEVGREGKEKQTQLQSLLKTPPNQVVQFSLSSKEIFMNFNNNVLIMESINMKHLYSLEAHEYPVTKIQLFDSIGLLITCGKDHSVKFWQFKYFPHLTMNNAILPFRKEPVTQQKQQVREQPTQAQQQMVPLKPELEDLDHWQ